LLGSLLLLSIYAGLLEWTVGGDKARYIGRGNELLGYLSALGRDGFNMDIFDILFLIPNITLASIHYVFRDNANFVTVLLNGILYFLAFIAIIYYVRTQIVDIPKIGIVFALCMVVSGFGLPGEVTKYVFNSYSSDVIGLFISTLALIATVIAIKRPRPGVWIAALGVSLLALLARPSGVVWIALVGIGFLASCRNTEYRHRIVLTTTAFCSIAAFLVWPFFVYTAATSIGDITSYGYELLVKRFSEGTVVTGRDSPHFGPLSGYLDYVLLMVTRFVYYFVPFREGYSHIHIVVNVFTMSFILVGLYQSASWFRTQTSEMRVIGSVVIASIIFTGIFYAATQVEDWRYYMAVWPSVWFLVAVGFSRTDIVRWTLSR